MNANAERILARMTELEGALEAELEAELAAKRREFRYRLEKGRAAFEREVGERLKAARQGWVAFLLAAPLPSLLVAPVIYSLIVPLILLDAWLFVYQRTCLRAYGIARVERSRYIVVDRSGLAGAHGRYKDFLDFGDADAYRRRLEDLRSGLRS